MKLLCCLGLHRYRLGYAQTNLMPGYMPVRRCLRCGRLHVRFAARWIRAMPGRVHWLPRPDPAPSPVSPSSIERQRGAARDRFIDN